MPSLFRSSPRRSRSPRPAFAPSHHPTSQMPTRPTRGGGEPPPVPLRQVLIPVDGTPREFMNWVLSSRGPARRPRRVRVFLKIGRPPLLLLLPPKALKNFCREGDQINVLHVIPKCVSSNSVDPSARHPSSSSVRSSRSVDVQPYGSPPPGATRRAGRWFNTSPTCPTRNRRSNRFNPIKYPSIDDDPPFRPLRAFSRLRFDSAPFWPTRHPGAGSRVAADAERYIAEKIAPALEVAGCHYTVEIFAYETDNGSGVRSSANARWTRTRRCLASHSSPLRVFIGSAQTACTGAKAGHRSERRLLKRGGVKERAEARARATENIAATR